MFTSLTPFGRSCPSSAGGTIWEVGAGGKAGSSLPAPPRGNPSVPFSASPVGRLERCTPVRQNTAPNCLSKSERFLRTVSARGSAAADAVCLQPRVAGRGVVRSTCLSLDVLRKDRTPALSGWPAHRLHLRLHLGYSPAPLTPVGLHQGRLPPDVGKPAPLSEALSLRPPLPLSRKPSRAPRCFGLARSESPQECSCRSVLVYVPLLILCYA